MACIMTAVGIPSERVIALIRDKPAFRVATSHLSSCPMSITESPLYAR